MRIQDSIKSAWLELFGAKLDPSLVEGDKMIRVWLDIYAGRPSWQTYTTRGLYGQRTEWRFLLNAGKMLTSELSGLVYAEEPKITVDDAVMDILKANKFLSNMKAWTETALALGNGALKWTFKDNRFIIDFVKAPDFLPVTYCNGVTTEADFASAIVKDSKEYKIVEQHRVVQGGYVITLKAYKKKDNGMFKECLPDEAGIDSEPVIIKTTRPLFVIWKNPEANNIDMYSPLGISLYANAVDTIQQLDKAFDNLDHERTDTMRKVIIGSSMISSVFDTVKKKQDVYYNKNDSVYVAFDDSDKENMMPKEIAFDFRIEQIVTDINTNLAIFCKQCGVSDNFLSFDGKSMKTATEVVSENSKTFRKKQTIENSLTPILEQFFSVLKDIGSLYDVPTTSIDYTVVWDDSVIEDRAAKETRVLARYNAKTLTLEDVLEQLDGLTEKQAIEKAEAIREQNATVSVGDIFGSE